MHCCEKILPSDAQYPPMHISLKSFPKEDSYFYDHVISQDIFYTLFYDLCVDHVIIKVLKFALNLEIGLIVYLLFCFLPCPKKKLISQEQFKNTTTKIGIQDST